MAQTAQLWADDEIDDSEMTVRLHRLTQLLMIEHDKHLAFMKIMMESEQMTAEAEEWLQGVEK